MQSEIHLAAAELRKYGLHTIRLRPRSKRPLEPAWQKRAEPDTDFGNGENVGVVLGARSGGLVDVDLDSQESIHTARLLLHDLPSFGRPSSRESHRIAVCNDLPAEAKTIRLSYEGSSDVLIELRATGGQTVFPPSIHEGTGELIQWTEDRFPEAIPEIGWLILKFKVGLIAFLAIVERNYPRSSGNRDDVSLALAGALLNMGVEIALADDLIVGIASRCGDDEAEQRAKARQTHDKRAAGEPVVGLPRLCELLGLDVGKISKLLAQTGVTAKEVTTQQSIFVSDCAEAAEKFVELERPTLMHLSGDYFAFGGTCYQQLEDKTVRSEVFKFLAKLRQPGPSSKRPWIPYRRTKSAVADVIQSLESLVHRPRDAFAPPCWLSDNDIDPDSIIACKNGLLDLNAETLFPPDPAFFTINAVEFDFDPDSRCGHWHEFLHQVFPSGERERQLLQ